MMQHLQSLFSRLAGIATFEADAWPELTRSSPMRIAASGSLIARPT